MPPRRDDAVATVIRTIPHLFDAAVADAPDSIWQRFEDETYTFAEARQRIGRAAAALTDVGFGKGDLVLTAPRNVPEHLFAWLAVGYIGAIVVTANPRSSEAELAGLAGQVEPRVVVVDDEVPAMAGVPAGASLPLDSLFADDAGVDGAGPAAEDDAVVLIPTSGTTGRSKLVTQTHRAYVMAGEGFPWWMELDAGDRMMTSLPLFHINAPAYTVLGSVAARAGLVLLPRFSASRFIDDARRHGATEFNAIGAMLEILMRQPERPDDAENPLRLAYAGPAPPRQRHLEIEERFGLRIVSGYAMSETPYGTIWARGTRPYGTLGSIRQHPELGVVNEGRVVDGELQLRNPAVMRGYWGMPEETSKVLLPDGWLRTGDLVEQNADGTYTFLGRLKEVIRRRGENVAPAEIEEALADHPDVHEVAVVGVPSELSEEEIKAFLLVADPAGADLAAIREHAAARLAPFKVPRYVEAVAELPHTPTGRIAKHRLSRERNEHEVDFDTARTGGR
jgi:crotonobetaine/carnitine-CoA ligase